MLDEFACGFIMIYAPMDQSLHTIFYFYFQKVISHW